MTLLTWTVNGHRIHGPSEFRASDKLKSRCCSEGGTVVFLLTKWFTKSPLTVHKVLEMEEKGEVDRLIHALSFKGADYEEVQWWATKALGKLGNAKAVEPLIAVLKEARNNPELTRARKAIVHSLRQLKDSRAVDVMLETLEEEDLDVRTDAAFYLNEFMEPRAIEKFIAMLNDIELDRVLPQFSLSITPERFLFLALVTGLGESGDPRAIEPLLKALLGEKLNHSDIFDSSEYIHAITEGQPLGELSPMNIKSLAETNRWPVFRALYALDPNLDQADTTKRAIPIYIDALGSANPRKQNTAIAILVALGYWDEASKDDTAIDGLISSVLRHGDLDPLLDLGDTGDPRAIKPLISHVKSPVMLGLNIGPGRVNIDGDQDGLNNRIESTLVAIGEPAVESLLSAVRQADSREVRRLLRNILSRIQSSLP